MRGYNFSAGPAMLPDSVLDKIKNELYDWNGTGVSVMEFGHRTRIFQDYIHMVIEKLKKIMNIPNNYKVVLLQGGGQGQFTGIPMNLTKHSQEVDYIVTGSWSNKAANYARSFAEVNIVLENNVNSIPALDKNKLNKEAAYLYYCPNETINGLYFPEVPFSFKEVPLVADMTSCILSENTDVSKFGLIFAGAQKNLGIAGLTIVVVRDDLLEQSLDITPPIWNYKLQFENNSTVNTPSTFAIYVMNLMLDWIEESGGTAKIYENNKLKAQKLYACIDANDFYANNVVLNNRSFINIPFNLPNDTLLNQFLFEAGKANFKYLNGHISVGGIRVSLYNAMPVKAVEELVDFMNHFVKMHG